MEAYHPTKILLVDQEPDFELLIKQFFRAKILSGKLEFYFCRFWTDALQLLNNDPGIHIVIVDVRTGQDDGLQLLEKIAAFDRFCKAIVISALGDMATVRRAMNHGAFDFLMKPVDFNDLDKSISRLEEHAHLYTETKEMQKELHDLEKQLDVARGIQQSFLPRHFNPMPERQTFELYGSMSSAEHVGGDFFDFFPVDSNHLGLVIADVSGKGVPAALYMAVSRTIIRTLALQTKSAIETVQEANHLLNQDNETSLFVTAFYAILNVTTGELVYCNAGHNTSLILTAAGAVEMLPMDQGLPLGILNGAELQSRVPYKENRTQLKKGDTLIMYTDGVTEAMNPENVAYGLDRFETALRKCKGLPLAEINQRILGDIHAFTGQAPQSDDCTLLALRFNGT